MFKLFQSKRAPETQIESAAPDVATGSAPSAETTAVVKSLLGAFAEEAANDCQKIEAIGKQISNVQTMLSNATDSRRAPEANARARDQIKAILGDLRALHAEFSESAIQLQKASR